MIMKHKKLIAISVIFLFCFFVDTSFADSIFDKLKEMIAGKKNLSVEDIVEETLEIKDEVRDLSEDYIIRSIKEYNGLIAEMRSEINSKTWYIFEKTDADRFNLIVDGIGEIKDLYVGLKKKKQNVRERMLSYIEEIRRFEAELSRMIPKEERIKQSLEREYALMDSNHRYNAEEREIRKKSLQKRIAFAERRIELLRNFRDNYQQILPVMKNANQSIERFIFVAEESADVYTDAYKTLKLQKDISNAYRTIDELKSLDYLAEDIMKSWLDMESIVRTLTNQVVGFDGSA